MLIKSQLEDSGITVEEFRIYKEDKSVYLTKNKIASPARSTRTKKATSTPLT